MSSVNSVEEIWNLALSALGHKKVASVGENSQQARVLRDAYPTVLSALLESYDWDFARRYVQLTQLDSSLVQNGWAAAHEWPADAVSLNGIVNPIRDDDNLVPHEVCQRNDTDARMILCDLEAPTASVTVHIEAPHRFTAHFVKALALALEPEIIRAISKEKDRERIATQKADYARREAERLSASTGVPRPLGPDVPPSIAARE